MQEKATAKLEAMLYDEPLRASRKEVFPAQY